MKKICIISTVPTHDTNAGHRARIKALADEYKRLGMQVYFLFINIHGMPNLPEMEKYFEGKLRIIEKTGIWSPRLLFIKIVDRLRIDYQRLMKHTRCHLVDGFYPFRYHNDLLKNLKSINPDIIQVEYPFLSHILEHFPNKTKVIDAHDVFHGRNKKIKNEAWFSLSLKEEKKALARADYVIAITDEDARVFNSYNLKNKILTVGHILQGVNPLPPEKLDRDPKLTIGFIGVNNNINVMTCERLISDVLPLTDIKVIIAGNICENLKNANLKKHIELIENVTLDEFYSKIDVLYNPTIASTGLKIKNVEALAYNKILITTHDGAQGLRDGIGNSFFCLDDFSGLQEILNKLKETNQVEPRVYFDKKSLEWKTNLKEIFEAI